MTTTFSPPIGQKTRPPTLADDWVDESLCAQVDPELFFPDTKGQNATQAHQYDAARSICQQCPVARQCLDAAMESEHSASVYYRFGMFGGLTPVERSDLAGMRPKSRSRRSAGH